MSEELYTIPTVTYRDIDAIYTDGVTKFLDEEQAELFQVDAQLSTIACTQVIDCYKTAFSRGDNYGYRRALDTFHEVLGINKLVAVVEYLKRGY